VKYWAALLLVFASMGARAGYYFEGVCLASRDELATLQCRSVYPVATASSITQCNSATGVSLLLETQSIPAGSVTYSSVAATAPECSGGRSGFFESVRWGNAAHVGQALLAALCFALFAHGYSIGARE
jgi:hypothetical protein